MKIIGHRGARGLAPENTIAGLRAGISQGVDGVEFDIHVTNDNIAVLSHDGTIEAADGSEYAIRAHSFAELQAVKPDLCSLGTALRAIDRQAQAFIEVKPGVNPEAVITVVRKLLVEGWTPQDFTFLSFDFQVLQALHAALPEVPIIVNEMWSGVRATARARKLGTKQIDIYQRWLWPGFIRAMSRRGYQLYSFTLNDPAKAQRWQTYGLYGIITDYPDRMRSLKTAGPKEL